MFLRSAECMSWEMGEKCNGIRYVLASDDSPGKDWAHEITVEKGEITEAEIRIES